ncbi:MAG: 30S ribosomal protein S5 [Patescibacteria group bacterium]|nr:30S ribosomal protein S5 [Patescibacteria group bacterium]MDD5490208.1 30S ribosomal protein S5 [Patescibacteria group bacterium]
MARRREEKFREEKEFEQKIIDLARVTRVVAGGKRMRFRACVAIGDGKGRVGMGLAKGADVTMAVNKAVNKARKNLIEVSIVNDTIPFEIIKKYKAAKIMIKPAPRGTGVKAGGAMRSIMELAGVPNVVGKIMGSSNKINIVRCTIAALEDLKSILRINPSAANMTAKGEAVKKEKDSKNIKEKEKTENLSKDKK